MVNGGYPLVIKHSYPLKVVIFNSYVSLPEGKSPEIKPYYCYAQWTLGLRMPKKKRFDFHEPIATCQEYVKFLYHHAAAEETTSFRHLLFQTI